MEQAHVTPENRAIILVGNSQSARLIDESRRNERGNDVRWAAKAAEASVLAEERKAAGGSEAGRLSHVEVEDIHDGSVSRMDVDGLFLLLGADPHCDWLPAGVALDKYGFVLTGRDTPRDTWVDGVPPEELATSLSGIFAVGDTRSGSMKRVASAVGEGASVVPMVHR
jgi:thioredoxin reductase (NADPH)